MTMTRNVRIQGSVIKKRFVFYQVTTHIVFHMIRLICFSYLLYDNAKMNFKPRKSISLAKDLIYVFLLGECQTYTAINGLINENKFGYATSSALTLHNAILSSIIIFFYNKRIEISCTATAIIFSLTNIFEFVASLLIIRINTITNNREIFQKIGADERKDRAYRTRTIVRVLNKIELFFMVLLINRYRFIPYNYRNRKLISMIVGITLTFFQKTCIVVNITQESTIQKIISIIITILKGSHVFYQIFNISMPLIYSKVVVVIIYCDTFVLNLLLAYYLMIDLNQFGSGLKESLQFRTRRINIS